MLHLNTPAKQKQFAAQALKRIRHHAPSVEEIAPIVIRAVFDNADSVYGHQYEGERSSGRTTISGRDQRSLIRVVPCAGLIPIHDQELYRLTTILLRCSSVIVN